MPVIKLEFLIDAPAARVFDLSRSVDLHIDSTPGTSERAVGGVTSGLLELDDEVTWSARHLGIRQRLTSRITEYDRPHHFRDSMIAGAFSRFDHDHHFDVTDDGCLMRDTFDFDAPLGLLGDVANGLFLTRYMERFLRSRCEIIKRIAETRDWTRYLAIPSQDDMLKEMSPLIDEAKARLGRGATPSDVANWLDRKRLGNIKVVFVFMKATGMSLGDAKGLGVWWGPDGVTDAEEFDEEAGRLLGEI